MVDGSRETDVEDQPEHPRPPILKAHPLLVFFHGAYRGLKTLVNRRKGKKTQKMENDSIEIDIENQHEHSRPPALGLHPLLVFSHGVDGRVQTFFSISETHDYVRSIPDMTNKCFCSCSHGWLIMLAADLDDCFLLNPESLEKIQLPHLEFYSWYCCVLSSAPDNPNGCFIVFFGHNYLTFCWPCDDESVMEELEYQNLCAIGCEGKIYAMGSDDMNNISLFEVRTLVLG
ncbi:uncharacterized protein LOC122060148 isoform X2 [Macadamia integrifolia]|uniref:uncharacterized protein LOC122060148 isoform X2 n=1 Tax=Macadamia integrifolia TaxID=60698 RepID=UPI001C52C69C|nr:uncharacterized protein LOC122060148 isoform X2 [Macadamia integrifolia]